MNESVFSMNSSYHIANELFAALSKEDRRLPLLITVFLPVQSKSRGSSGLGFRLARDLKSEQAKIGRRSLASGTGGRVGQPRLVLCRQGSGQP